MSETTGIIETKREKPYQFRAFEADDIFLMLGLVNKIGIDEFKPIFENDGMKKIAGKAAKNGETVDKDEMYNSIGIAAVLEIANILLRNITKCREDIYAILAATSNLTAEEIKKLRMATFAEMVIDFVKKDDFADFLSVVSGSFK